MRETVHPGFVGFWENLIAAAAGVVRRTVCGHFPSRLDLVRTLTERAVGEMTAVLAEAGAAHSGADATWLLADLVERGQDSAVFAQHLPAGVLSRLAYGAVFAIADSDLPDGTTGVRAATITSPLMLGVPAPADAVSRRA